MHSTGTLIILRLLHIVLGAFWAGGAIFLAFFIVPSVRAVGPAAGPIMDQLGRVRKMPIYMMLAAIITVLSGLSLFYIDSAGFSNPWMQSGTGRTVSMGALCAIIAVITGMTVTSPTVKKIGAMSAAIGARGGPPTPEEQATMQALQKRFGMSTMIVAVLVLLAISAMAVARYVP